MTKVTNRLDRAKHYFLQILMSVLQVHVLMGALALTVQEAIVVVVLAQDIQTVFVPLVS